MSTSKVIDTFLSDVDAVPRDASWEIRKFAPKTLLGQ